MKTLKAQTEELIAQQTELARQAAACFNMATYRTATARIKEAMEFLKSLN